VLWIWLAGSTCRVLYQRESKWSRVPSSEWDAFIDGGVNRCIPRIFSYYPFCFSSVSSDEYAQTNLLVLAAVYPFLPRPAFLSKIV